MPDAQSGSAAAVQRPTMGRIVHYVDEEGEAMPAIVRAAYEGDPDLCDLTGFAKSGIRVESGVRRCEEHSNFSWHWPERV